MPENNEVTPTQLDKAQLEQVSESVGHSVLEKVKDFFSTQKQEETYKSQEDFEKAVTAKVKELTDGAVQEQLNKVIPELKKSKQQELDAKEQELANEKAKLEQQELQSQQEKELENVDDMYKDFVKFEAEKKNKSVIEFISENPQYQVNKANVQSQHGGADKTEETRLDRLLARNKKK